MSAHCFTVRHHGAQKLLSRGWVIEIIDKLFLLLSIISMGWVQTKVLMEQTSVHACLDLAGNFPRSFPPVSSLIIHKCHLI